RSLAFSHFCSFYSSRDHRDLLSFPTRRSSDLLVICRVESESRCAAQLLPKLVALQRRRPRGCRRGDRGREARIARRTPSAGNPDVTPLREAGFGRLDTLTTAHFAKHLVDPALAPGYLIIRPFRFESRPLSTPFSLFWPHLFLLAFAFLSCYQFFTAIWGGPQCPGPSI